MVQPHRLGFIAFFLPACGQHIIGEVPRGWGDLIVDDIGEAQVLDARSAEEWEAGHIPGAAQLHWTEVTGFDEADLWAQLPDGDLAGLLGERGIASDRPVVVYGSGPDGYGDDGDLYWTLRYLGQREVRILNGGWLGWLASGGQVSTAGDRPESTVFAYATDDSVLADTAMVQSWEGVLLDVRSAEEWEAGHIPGAVWMEWTEVFDDDGYLLPEDDIVALMAGMGIARDTPVITYCAGGIRAGHTFMVLEAMGVDEVRNYVGSWSRWTGEGGEVEY